jgi:outer membrane receptor protein involved in Fe transport
MCDQRSGRVDIQIDLPDTAAAAADLNIRAAFHHPAASVPVSDTYNLVARASNVLVGPSRALTYFPQELPGYGIVNARAGLVSSRWPGFLYVNNLTDRRAFLDNVPDYLLNIPHSTASPRINR